MGLPLIAKLDSQGHRVFVTSRFTHTDSGNVRYIVGNARDLSFVESICGKLSFDAIVDFMVYDIFEFKKRYQFMLECTKQYIFLSSSRVYAFSDDSLTENSPRLLDVVDDEDYLNTNEYALRKAREENLLFNASCENWTIIRPYITYSTNRLQLGTLEKEYWLKRALAGKSIVITRNTYNAKTSLTFGDDVSRAIAELIGNESSYGEAIHIVNEENMTWGEVLELYLEVIEQKEGFRPKYKILDDYEGLASVLGNQYQMEYDRFYNRKFNSSKAARICGHELVYKQMKVGLTDALAGFLNGKRSFLFTDWCYEAYADRVTNETTKLSCIPGWKSRIKYVLWRYVPIRLLIWHRRKKKQE